MKMKRKLVKQGTSTLMISLPSKWVQKFNLEKGSEIDITNIENNLLISADEIRQIKKETTIKITKETESSIRTLITNAYRAGVDKITVEFNNQELYKQIQTIVTTKLIGFEILKKEKNKCIIENITEPSDNQFDNILLKIFYNISELFKITKERLEGIKPIDDYKEVEDRTQKYDNFCKRTISKKDKTKKSELMWSFLSTLQHAHREIYHLNKSFESEIKASKELIKELISTEEIFTLIKEAYLKKDFTILETVHLLEKEVIYSRGYSLLKKVSGQERIILLHMMMSIKHFYLCSSPLMGFLIE